MKYITIILFIFFVFPANAQGNTSLTKQEFESAKEKYMVMLKSVDYVQLSKINRKIAEKMKGTELPRPTEKDTDYVSFMNTWLKANISKTKFSSEEEGAKLFKESYELAKKTQVDNKDFFTLFSRANDAQKLEIIELENRFDRLYDLRNGN